jgi:hypothetical protein
MQTQMKRILTTLTALLFAVVLVAQDRAKTLNGIWANEQNSIRIEFFKASSGYAAKIVWMAKPNDDYGKPLKDAKNPNPSLRKNPLIGTVLLYNLQFDGKDGFGSGKLYAPKRGVIADCSVRVVSSDKIEITGKKGLYQDTKKWSRCK